MASVKKRFDPRRLAASAVALGLLAACQTTGPAATPESSIDRYLTAAARKAEAEGDHQAASTHYRALADERPKDKEVVLALARSLQRSDAADEGIARLRAALDSSGPDAELLVELGKMQIVAGRPEEAKATLEQAAKVAPNDAGPLHALAMAEDRLGDHEAASSLYERALKRDPGNAALLNNYAMSLALAGDVGRARGLLNRAAALPGAPERIHANLALLDQLGAPDDVPPGAAGASERHAGTSAAAPAGTPSGRPGGALAPAKDLSGGATLGSTNPVPQRPGTDR
ncbi:tetratricopeptide repeat protein [Azospirillum sp. SYSU D00513]|uniref:tetratricopeptide repeat protein n=1 Tax=Azospirillum sp. SYSU D00513 TaxID=2812561 RepID=UPI001A977EA0|nr:tetratricopeptide repeat protein [Azospirillum sp. SYSU D00513]